MKTRIVKIYGRWVVEFPFAVVVYCDSFATAVKAFQHFDDYLLASETARISYPSI